MTKMKMASAASTHGEVGVPHYLHFANVLEHFDNFVKQGSVGGISWIVNELCGTIASL